MGNIVLKEDGITPRVPATYQDDNDKVCDVPEPYLKLAQAYIDTMAAHEDVRASTWRNVYIFGGDKRGKFVLQCGFDTLRPCFPEPFSGPHPMSTGVPVDFTAQMASVCTWLPGSVEKTHLRMNIGPANEYLFWITLVLPRPDDIRDARLRELEAENARLKEELYWSPGGEGYQSTRDHFHSLKQ